jgi:hypothetical protein
MAKSEPTGAIPSVPSVKSVVERAFRSQTSVVRGAHVDIMFYGRTIRISDPAPLTLDLCRSGFAGFAACGLFGHLLSFLRTFANLCRCTFSRAAKKVSTAW